jgi:hypothetical protein
LKQVHCGRAPFGVEQDERRIDFHSHEYTNFDTDEYGDRYADEDADADTYEHTDRDPDGRTDPEEAADGHAQADLYSEATAEADEDAETLKKRIQRPRAPRMAGGAA